MISVIGLVPIMVVVSPIVVVVVIPMVIVAIPPVVMSVIGIIPGVVCIPVPQIHPVIVIGIIIKDVVCRRIDVDRVAVVVHKPIIDSAAILQIPIEIGRKQSAW